jgi:septal ring factor EnvC (AmiA/AmiB activator)
VDYDALSMLNISATQELIRQVESQGEELARLRDELAKARKEKQQLTAHVSEMDSRLARLEGMLRQQASTPGASTDRALTQVGYQNPNTAGR